MLCLIYSNVYFAYSFIFQHKLLFIVTVIHSTLHFTTPTIYGITGLELQPCFWNIKNNAIHLMPKPTFICVLVFPRLDIWSTFHCKQIKRCPCRLINQIQFSNELNHVCNMHAYIPVIYMHFVVFADYLLN